MNAVQYSDGEQVRLGDVVDIGHGRGPKARVVVIIPTGEAAAGFTASEWAYLGQGVIFQDQVVFGLLHLREMGHEQILVQRA